MTQVPTWLVWTLFGLGVLDAVIKLLSLSTQKYPRTSERTVGMEATMLVMSTLTAVMWFYFIRASGQ